MARARSARSDSSINWKCSWRTPRPTRPRTSWPRNARRPRPWSNPSNASRLPVLRIDEAFKARRGRDGDARGLPSPVEGDPDGSRTIFPPPMLSDHAAAGARRLGDPRPRGASQEPAGRLLSLADPSRRSIASRLPGRPARAIAPPFCASPSRRWSRRSVSRRPKSSSHLPAHLLVTRQPTPPRRRGAGRGAEVEALRAFCSAFSRLTPSADATTGDGARPSARRAYPPEPKRRRTPSQSLPARQPGRRIVPPISPRSRPPAPSLRPGPRERRQARRERRQGRAPASRSPHEPDCPGGLARRTSASSGTDTLAIVICPEREASAVDEPACWRLRA